MTGRLGRWVAGWIERGRRAGILLLIIALCAGLGLLVALPLWLFATRQPRIYTIVALALLAGGLVFLAVRSFGRRLPSDAAHPGASFLTRLLTAFIAIISLAWLYLVAVLVYRGLWVLGVMATAIGGVLLWLLGAARAATRKRRKPTSNPAENSGR